MNTITISRKATAKAQGKLNSKHCKPVLCIDTGEVFSSVFDASERYGVTPSCVSMNCNGKLKTTGGKHFCFVSHTSEHLDDIVARIKANAVILEKAAAYDAMIAEQQAKANAIAKAEEEMKEQERLYAEHLHGVDEAQRKYEEAKQRLEELKAESELIALQRNAG